MIDILNKVRPPNSLSVISLALADIAINNIEKAILGYAGTQITKDN